MAADKNNRANELWIDVQSLRRINWLNKMSLNGSLVASRHLTKRLIRWGTWSPSMTGRSLGGERSFELAVSTARRWPPGWSESRQRKCWTRPDRRANTWIWNGKKNQQLWPWFWSCEWSASSPSTQKIRVRMMLIIKIMWFEKTEIMCKIMWIV